MIKHEIADQLGDEVIGDIVRAEAHQLAGMRNNIEHLRGQLESSIASLFYGTWKAYLRSLFLEGSIVLAEQKEGCIIS